MKNQTCAFLKGTLSVFVFSLLLLTTESSFATVGGPTYISDFKYNPADESVYYIVNSQSGRGCPPELAKISLNSGISEMALSCDEGEKILEREGIYDISPVFQKIYE
ncbi:MAG: hypothetical protein Q8P86_02360, partial [bacterium]|nr:hypothetical protein [bacterium]